MRRLIWNENDQSGPQKVKRLSCIPKNYWNIVFNCRHFLSFVLLLTRRRNERFLCNNSQNWPNRSGAKIG